MGALFPSSGVSLNGQQVVTVFSDYCRYRLREHTRLSIQEDGKEGTGLRKARSSDGVCNISYGP